MSIASPKKGSRAEVLRLLAERVLEAPDLRGLARLLAEALATAIGARQGTLLLWDRKLEVFEECSAAAGVCRVEAPSTASAPQPRDRWLVAEGQLIDTGGGEPMLLVPLRGRSGLVGMLRLGPLRAKAARPLRPAEVRALWGVASHAALALENHVYLRELLAAERMVALGTIAGMLAHDLRGPMTVIRGYAETLAEDELPEAEFRSRAALIVESVDRLERMTSQTLEFARGAEPVTRRLVPLPALLYDIAQGLSDDLPGLSVVRRFSIPAHATGALDVDKLRRALTNLASNALDAMGGRGEIVMRASLEDDPTRLVLHIEDQGPGVPAEVRERLFEPFATFGKRKGTGLGLAVARRFIEDHGGTIDLVFPPAGGTRGAEFRVAIPLTDSPGDEAGVR